MKLFYTRISSITQSAGRQIENLKKIEGYNPDNLFLDKIQGNVPFLERPKGSVLFDVCTNHKKEEMVEVYVDSIDRWGRNTLEILNTIQLFTINNIRLIFLKEGFSTLLDDGRENPTAKLILAVMATLAELERNRIKERVMEGVAIAKAHGKYKGRKVGACQTDEKLLQRHSDIVNKLNRNWSVRAIANTTQKSSVTITKVRKVLLKRKGLSN